MKSRLLVLTLLTFVPLLAWTQSTNQIVIGQIDSIQSKILNEKRQIWVHLPKTYHDSTFAKQRYPVVYLLDGDDHFASVASMIDYESAAGTVGYCPDMIVVGILNTNRSRDLTPTSGGGLIPSPRDSILLKNSGGGENFTAFLERELIPYIEAHYPTQPYRVFIGHSFGGLMVINTLVYHPQLFNAYVAIDPSMWWAKRQLLSEAKQRLSSLPLANKTLFLGIANTMNPGQDTLQVQRDTTARNNHIRSILLTDRLFRTTKPNGLRYERKYYPQDDHGSVPFITEYDALRFIFESYPFRPTNQEFQADNTGLATRLVSHFARVSKAMGYSVYPPEALINQFGYFFVVEKRWIAAESLLKLNLANYPQSPNVYDSMGDYYLARKDTTNAIVQYQKALSLKEIAETRKKLIALQAKAAPGSSPADKPKK